MSRVAPQICPGPCSRAWRRAEASGEPHDIPEPWGNPTWCDRDAGIVHRCLGQLPELYAAIHLEALHASPPPMADRITTSSEHTWPGARARLLTDEIVGGLAELEDDLRDLRNLSPRPARGTEGPAIAGCIAFLTQHLEWLLQQHPNASDPDGSPGALILRWQRRAERFCRRDDALERLPVRCPDCAMLGLRRYGGSEYIECAGCARLWTADEYRLLTLASVHKMREAS